MFGGNFAPHQWASCDGQILPISQNTALFSLLGTTYGGNGQSTFALPNFQGSAAMGAGQGGGLSDRTLGETGGEQAVNLQLSQMPQHTHGVQAGAGGARGGSNTPANNFLGSGVAGSDRIYAPSGSNSTMNPQAVSVAGGNIPHNNMPPFLCVFFIIAMAGIFPARP
jgi:microcystin-dependent protein